MICSKCGIFTDDKLQSCIGCGKTNPLNPKTVKRMTELGKALIELSKENMYKEDLEIELDKIIQENK